MLETPNGLDGLNVAQLRASLKLPYSIVKKIIHLFYHSFDEAWAIRLSHCLIVKVCVVINQSGGVSTRGWEICGTILKLMHELIMSRLQGDKRQDV